MLVALMRAYRSLLLDADNVERVAVNPESGTEAAGRRLQSTTLQRRPVLRVSDASGVARAEISDGLTLRDGDTEGFTADKDGFAVKDTDGVTEKVRVDREGLGVRGGKLSVRDETGASRFEADQAGVAVKGESRAHVPLL